MFYSGIHMKHIQAMTGAKDFITSSTSNHLLICIHWCSDVLSGINTSNQANPSNCSCRSWSLKKNTNKVAIETGFASILTVNESEGGVLIQEMSLFGLMTQRECACPREGTYLWQCTYLGKCTHSFNGAYLRKYCMYV